jgi:IclR family KDG regulon transcriptional repressor
MDRSDEPPILQSVDLSISVLMEIAKHADIRLTEIAQNLGETKPRILRSLRTMKQRSFVQRTESGGYRLGNAILVLGTAASSQIDLVKLASPILESLSQKVNETVQLRIRDHAEALCIAKFEPSRDLRVHAVVGRRRPLHAGSSKVLLAFLPPDLQMDLIPRNLDRLTPRTPVDRDRLLADLNGIRKRGYCISHGEVSEQLVSVAAPILAFGGSVIGGINIAAPAFRTQQADLDRYVALVTEAAREISEGLSGERR